MKSLILATVIALFLTAPSLAAEEAPKAPAVIDYESDEPIPPSDDCICPTEPGRACICAAGPLVEFALRSLALAKGETKQ